MMNTSVIIYITIAIFLLLLISQNNHTNTKHHRHRRLKLRSNFTFTPPSVDSHQKTKNPIENHVPFDPLVAEIERRREDKHLEQHSIDTHHPELSHEHAPGAESQPGWKEFVDPEDYLNDEEKFNMTSRLLVLFPKIDVAPADGFWSEGELTQWNMEQSQKEVLHRTEREMEVHDKNRDGFVSFEEYDPPSWVKNADNNSFGYDMGWWKEEHFNASDSDGDGLLNLTEFNDFLHPADTRNPKLLQWLCQEEIRERDTDKDGKVGFKEFFRGLFDLVRNYDEKGPHGVLHHYEDSGETPARKMFAKLDKDGDGFLSDLELMPIIENLHPSERYYAKQQADYIIQQADSDKDGRLSLTERSIFNILHPLSDVVLQLSSTHYVGFLGVLAISSTHSVAFPGV